MRVVYICIVSILLFGGCSATVKGVKQDSKESYDTVKGGVHDSRMGWRQDIKITLLRRRF